MTISQPPSLDIDDIESLWGPPASLLPRNFATQLDDAQEMTDAARYPMNFGDVIRAKDPYACPDSILPFLAWEREVNLWKSWWPDAEKRYATDQSIPQIKKKGTYTGFEVFTAMAGGKVLSIFAPPMMAFPGADMTASQRAAWLSQFPQLRLYPYVKGGVSRRAWFACEQSFMVQATDGSQEPPWLTLTSPPVYPPQNIIPPSIIGFPVIGGTLTIDTGTWVESDFPAPPGLIQSVQAFYPPPSLMCIPDIDYSLYVGNETVFYENGVSIPIQYYETQVQGADGVFTEYDQVVLPGSMEDCWFAGNDPMDASNPGAVLMVSDMPGGVPSLGWFPISLNLIAERTITSLRNNPPIGVDPSVYTTMTVAPGLAPISVYPDTIYQNGPTQLAEWYADHFPVIPSLMSAYVVDGEWGYFPTIDRASQYIYDVLYLYDPSAVAAPQKLPPSARCFCDNTFIQYPAYTAQVNVEVFGTLPTCDLGFWWGDGNLTNPSFDFMWDIVTAIRAVKSARDLVWVNTKTYDIAVPDVSLICGTIVCGQMIPILPANLGSP